MSKSSNLNVRLDPLVKEQAENILTQLGMPMASAVSIFLQQVVLQNGLPFEVKLPTAKLLLMALLLIRNLMHLWKSLLLNMKMGKCYLTML